ncbi:putative Translation protein SH3-like, subgroup protein [Trachipleistophora hominis]|uniref:Putative Translation protein SH3-like, subgroup protein n=1 Tax=Trachipleistophora hominis TaxID=72359 RepID=L7JYL9_TRAHO|nr:putative Translation protein SH3-like, subgroup protein [Trachipleistophora hominis]
MEDKKTIFRKKMLVILTRGRQASRKAVVLEVLEDERLLVAGFTSKRRNKNRNNKSATMFIKRMNPMHVLATEHVANVDLSVEDVEKVFADMKYKRDTLKTIEQLIEKRADDRNVQWMKKSLVMN